MIHLNLKTGYNFRKAFGMPANIIEAAGKVKALGIADELTWGHIPFYKECKKNGIKPILGVELKVLHDKPLREKQQVYLYTFIAKNAKGLGELYRIVEKSYEHFYYFPRLYVKDIKPSKNLFILVGESSPSPLLGKQGVFLQASPSYTSHWNEGLILELSKKSKTKIVATCDNYYPTVEDKGIYEAIADRNAQQKTTPQHILTGGELRLCFDKLPESAFTMSDKIAEGVEEFELPKAELVELKGMDLDDLCEKGIKKRKLKMTKVYKDRLKHELSLIRQKGYEDYFYLVADTVNYAKKHMLVGPARGSAAGSLVSFLLGITDVDPIVHGLFFERFIDITRADLPDIDIDFPDNKREMVIDYLKDKYGVANVAHIGTIARYMPKIAITDLAKVYGVPLDRTNDFKNSIVERSGGDARAALCIEDTFTTTDIGKDFVKDFPEMLEAKKIEGHPRHNGVHAAGILVCKEPVSNYAPIDPIKSVALIDKKMAEDLNMLKLDILGLRTLSVLNTILELVGLDREVLVNLPLDDKKAFSVFKKEKWTGIFQFEGYALQILAKQMGVKNFNDIVAITSLARPGPLHCGGATDFINRRTGREEITYLHDSVIPHTKETYGTIVFQEQVMSISRDVGEMTWEDVNQLRRAMSKSLGEEFFNQYWEKFKKGAKKKKVNEVDARKIWDTMCTFGSWAFNKSHAVSYGLLSYWCAYLKAHHPLEFALACLQNERHEESTIKLLRELVKEDYEYEPFNRETSGVNWSIQDGKLVGGLTNIKGIGIKKAKEIIGRRKNNFALTPSMEKMLSEGKTPFDDVFECETRFGDYYVNPTKYNINTQELHHIEDMHGKGKYIFIGRLKEKNLRDLNEYASVVKRGGKIIKSKPLFLNMLVEDDTDSIFATIDRWKYQQFGKQIVEEGIVGESWYLIRGTIRSDDWRKIYIEKIRKLA